MKIYQAQSRLRISKPIAGPRRATVPTFVPHFQTHPSHPQFTKNASSVIKSAWAYSAQAPIDFGG